MVDCSNLNKLDLLSRASKRGSSERQSLNNVDLPRRCRSLRTTRTKLCVGVYVLAVRLSAATILNGEFWATMQTPQAHSAALNFPYRPLVHHANRLHRTIPRAQTTAHAGLFDMEVRRLSHMIVIGMMRQTRHSRKTALHVVASRTLPQLIDDIFNLRLHIL